MHVLPKKSMARQGRKMTRQGRKQKSRIKPQAVIPAHVTYLFIFLLRCKLFRAKKRGSKNRAFERGAESVGMLKDMLADGVEFTQENGCLPYLSYMYSKKKVRTTNGPWSLSSTCLACQISKIVSIANEVQALGPGNLPTHEST